MPRASAAARAAEAAKLAQKMLASARRRVAAPLAAEGPEGRITLAEAELWAARARAGAWIAYGFGPDLEKAADPEVAAFLYRLAEHGFVHLFQRREGDGAFVYLAQRSSRSWRAA